MGDEQSIDVLYIEDDRGQAALMQKKLGRAGYTVQLAYDGLQGLSICAQRSFEVLLVDHRIPGMSGIEIIRHLSCRNILPATVMVTGAGDEKTAVEAMRLGASDYIVKDPEGVYFDLLPVILQRILERRRLADAKREAEQALREAYDGLEHLVAQRTAELVTANRVLEDEINERKRAEHKLRVIHENLERLVAQRTRELVDKTDRLEELNVALKVLLQKREEDKRLLEENISSNVTSLIMPCIEKLRHSRLSCSQRAYLDALAHHLSGIVSPFARKVSSKYYNLTPTEIRVAGLIKQDKTTKDIADAFNISESAIVFHRHNIRRKLGLSNKKLNLRSFLLTLE